MAIKILSLEQHTEEVLLTPDGGARARRWRDLPARLGSMEYLTLQPGGVAPRLYYPESEDSYYVLHGRGRAVDLARETSAGLEQGLFVHFPAGLPHQLEADGAQPLVLVGGPCPPAPNAFEQRGRAAGRSPAKVDALVLEALSGPDSPAGAHGRMQVLETSAGPDIPLIRPPMPGGYARFPIWPKMGAQLRSMNCVVMRPGQENVPHVHPVSEDIFYCLSGRCVIENGETGEEQPFRGGCLIFIDPGTTHAVKSLGPENYVSVGGPCPPDMNIFRRFGLLG